MPTLKIRIAFRILFESWHRIKTFIQPIGMKTLLLLTILVFQLHVVSRILQGLPNGLLVCLLLQ